MKSPVQSCLVKFRNYIFISLLIYSYPNTYHCSTFGSHSLFIYKKFLLLNVLKRWHKAQTHIINYDSKTISRTHSKYTVSKLDLLKILICFKILCYCIFQNLFRERCVKIAFTRHLLNVSVLKSCPQSAALASSGSLLEMQNLRPLSRYTKSESEF